jgi:hypothetical protein
MHLDPLGHSWLVPDQEGEPRPKRVRQCIGIRRKQDPSVGMRTRQEDRSV